MFETLEKLNPIKNVTAAVKRLKGAEPVFRNTRPVPYSLLQKVDVKKSSRKRIAENNLSYAVCNWNNDNEVVW